MTNQSGGDQNKKKGQGINDMILGGIKSRSGKETTKWLNNLTSENIEDAVEAAAQDSATDAATPPASSATVAQSQVQWVDKLFDYFSQYQVEFNRAVQNSELKMDSERPIITGDLISRMQGSDSHHYSGRLHTRFWTLAIIGNLNSVEGYIIPSDHYIGFEKNRSKYTQFFQFFPIWDGELKWSIDHGAIGINQLPTLAKQIFGHLIRVSKGEVDDQQRFGFGLPTKINNGKQSGSAKIESAPPEYLLNHGGVFDEGPAIQTIDHALKSTVIEPKSSSHFVASTASADAPAVQAPSPTISSSASASSHSNSFSSSSTQISAEPGLNEACDILGRAIERELDLLSKAGAKAFEDHDFSKVEVLMKRTSKMKSMRDQMLNTIKEWKQKLGDE
ncbi:MAG: hypothetical protein K2X81_23455 [Candidatus Obscuribacterales bacterium]|nr:hypothetical protein [Candidatus Obscuribacterales bacterium]